MKIRIEAAMLRDSVEELPGKPPRYPPLIPSPLAVGSFGGLRTQPDGNPDGEGFQEPGCGTRRAGDFIFPKRKTTPGGGPLFKPCFNP